MPILVPAIIIKNPMLYPNVILASHIEGVEGSRKIGNKPIDPISTNTSAFTLKVVASQSKIVIICLPILMQEQN